MAFGFFKLLLWAKLSFWGSIILLLCPAQIVIMRFFPKQSRYLPLYTHRLLLKIFGARVCESGAPPPSSSPVLILANHISWFDIFVLGAAHPLSFIAKAEISRWPVARWLAALQRTLFIDRNRKSATATTNRQIATRLKQGDTIVLFAEGTTSDGIRILPFRPSLLGALNEAVSEGETIQVQPVTLLYHRRYGLPLTRRDRPLVAWYGDMSLMPHLVTFFSGGPLDIELIWGDPLLCNVTSNRKIISAQAKNAIRSAFLSKIPEMDC
jgi:lyso-ornithine lipid O-acyltransferase